MAERQVFIKVSDECAVYRFGKQICKAKPDADNCFFLATGSHYLYLIKDEGVNKVFVRVEESNFPLIIDARGQQCTCYTITHKEIKKNEGFNNVKQETKKNTNFDSNTTLYKLAIIPFVLIIIIYAFHDKKTTKLVTREITNDLVIYNINYSKIDLVCDKQPDEINTNILFCASAAFSAKLLNEFNHSNICGNHVSSGKYYAGSPCIANSGAFVYYNDSAKFLYQDYSSDLKKAANNGGMGFGQCMLIHNGEKTPIFINVKDNLFRAICLKNNKLHIIDSKKRISLDSFVDKLSNIGVTEALYLVMGESFNYSWYRDEEGNVQRIHNIQSKYATNWIVFYK